MRYQIVSFLLFSVIVFSGQAMGDWKEDKYFLKLKSLSDGFLFQNPDASEIFVKAKEHSTDHERLRFYQSLANTIKALEHSAENPEVRFNSFLESLRITLSTEFYCKNKNLYREEWGIKLIQDLIHVYFTGTKIQSFLENLVEKVTEHGQKKVQDLAGIAEISEFSETAVGENHKFRIRLGKLENKLKKIYEVQNSIIRGKSWLGISVTERAIGNYYGGVTWSFFDPPLQGNIPYLKFRIHHQDQPEAVNYIRMATPTINSNDQTMICPEFLAYLDYLKNHDLSHTYVNFQDAVKPTFRRIKNIRRLGQYLGIGNESHRTRTLQNLEADPRYQGTFKIITLTRDSGFYQQSRWADKKKKDAVLFISEFLSELFDGNNNGYYLPESWRKKEKEQKFRKDMGEILHSIHRKIFDSKISLTKKERRIFIEISYAFIADFAVRGSYSVNQTCKSGIDRAGSANAMTLLLSLIQMAQNPGLSEDAFDQLSESLVPMLFEDALAAKMRELKEPRLKRFYEASLHLVLASKKRSTKSDKLEVNPVLNIEPGTDF